MCFGSKKDDSGELAARPASMDKKASKKEYRASGEPHSGAFAGQTPLASAAAPAPAPSTAPAVQPAPDKGSAPPAGPPPSYDQAGPSQQSQHDWQVAVPDTSLFPPPPDIFGGFKWSPTTNASDAEATAGADWCRKYPMNEHPMTIDDAGRAALAAHNLRLMEPAGFNGKLTWMGQGHWQGYSAKKSRDRCIISYPPLYLAREPPTATGKPKTIYYEVKLRQDSPTQTLAMGFAALPYPSFRLPGWHRGSLAVHGDDGHRYVHDPWGGKAFTEPFRKGDTYGLGMTFRATEHGGQGIMVDVFFTRNGVLSGGWNIHEETDAEEDQDVRGLGGESDLCAAVGTFDGVSFEVIFQPSKWLYKDVAI